MYEEEEEQTKQFQMLSIDLIQPQAITGYLKLIDATHIQNYERLAPNTHLITQIPCENVQRDDICNKTIEQMMRGLDDAYIQFDDLYIAYYLTKTLPQKKQFVYVPLPTTARQSLGAPSDRSELRNALTALQSSLTDLTKKLSNR